MASLDPRDVLDKHRAAIAERVRQLRLARHLNQAELSRRLGVSQGRLSEIERGAGSLTAEQFLLLLQLFEVEASEFTAPFASASANDREQTAARLRALYVRGSAVSPSEQLRRVAAVLREVLAAPTSLSLVTALAPVLVYNADVLELDALCTALGEPRLVRRFGWLAENTVGAIANELPSASRAFWRKLRRASSALDACLQALAAERPGPDVPPDALDPELCGHANLEEALAMSSPISRRWAIVSRLECRHFAEALRDAQAYD